MGDQLAIMTLTVRLHDQGVAGAWIAGLFIAGLLPIVLFGPLAGAIVDRFETVRLVAAVTIAQGLISALLIFASSPAIILMLVALLGCGLAIAAPALLTLVPALTRHTPSKGYARLETFRLAGTVVGPALAGVLLTVIGAGGVLLVDALSFLLLGGTLLCLPLRQRPTPHAPQATWIHEVMAGARVLARDRVLGLAIPVLAATVLFTSVFVIARVFFIQDILHAGAAGYGLAVAAHAAGMLLGAAFIGSRVRAAHQTATLGGAGIIMGGALLLVSVAPVLPVALIGFLLTGIANAVQGLAIRNLIHARITERFRGRAFASSSAVFNGSTLIGMSLGGVLVTAIGSSRSLTTAGAGTLIISLLAWRSLGIRSRIANGPVRALESSEVVGTESPFVNDGDNLLHSPDQIV